jgi:fucose 4-O-acetylase-like acetyltransferase
MTTNQTLPKPITTAPVSVQDATPSPRSRVPLWDNARFVAVVLVVIGHATLKLIAGSDPAYSVYLFIYLFHIPVFVAVSGYFARSTPPGVPQIKRLFTDIVVPYVIFETIWSGIHWAISGKLKLDYTTAWWTLWFLLALCIWRVVLPYLVILRFPMTISILLAVGAGYLSSVDDTLSLGRAVALLPFFVLGWKIKQWKLAEWWLGRRTVVVWRWRAAALALFATLATVSAVGIDTWRELLVRRFLLYDETYSSFGYGEWWAGAIRIGVIGIGMLCCFGFLALMPRRQTWLSGLGTRTMYIYLLHSLLLYPLRQSGILDGRQSPLMLIGVIALSIAIAVLLGLPIIQRVFRPLVEPRLAWLFRRSEQAPT